VQEALDGNGYVFCSRLLSYNGEREGNVHN
jgi:hypothetical protein